MAALEKFGSVLDRDFTIPATHAFAITPHDTNQLATVTRAIYVGAGGDITLILRDDTVAVTLVAVPTGTILPMQVRLVKSQGTSAATLIGLY